MERIINTLDIQAVLPSPYANRLKGLGMRESDYPLITDEAIAMFLTERLRGESKKKDRHGPIVREFGVKQGHGGIRHQITTGCVHREIVRRRILPDKEIVSKDWKWTIWWDEMPLARYEGNPPPHVLDAALRAKRAGYVCLRVVTTNARVVEDPLLVAIKGGKRYLVDWWDKDFTSDEIISLVEQGESHTEIG